MTSRFEHFNARPDGSYRLVLAYADASVPQRDGRLGRSPHTLSACLEFADEINSFFRASSAGPCLSPS